MLSTASTMQTIPAVSATFAPFFSVWLGAGCAGGCFRCGRNSRRLLSLAARRRLRKIIGVIDEPLNVECVLIVGKIEDHVRVLSENFKVREHSRRRRVALGDIRRHGVHCDLLEALRDIGVELARGMTGLALMCWMAKTGVSPSKGRPASQHFVHHDAKRVEVGPVVNLAALGLLGEI